jgi:hypothetical protein
MRATDTKIDLAMLLRRSPAKENIKPRTAAIPKTARYSHMVWGVSTEGNALCHVDGRFFVPRFTVPVYYKPNRLGW